MEVEHTPKAQAPPTYTQQYSEGGHESKVREGVVSHPKVVNMSWSH